MSTPTTPAAVERTPSMSDARRLSLEMMRLYDLSVLHERLYEVVHRDFLRAVACELQHFDAQRDTLRADLQEARAALLRQGLEFARTIGDAGCPHVPAGEVGERDLRVLYQVLPDGETFHCRRIAVERVSNSWWHIDGGLACIDGAEHEYGYADTEDAAWDLALKMGAEYLDGDRMADLKAARDEALDGQVLGAEGGEETGT